MSNVIEFGKVSKRKSNKEMLTKSTLVTVDSEELNKLMEMSTNTTIEVIDGYKEVAIECKEIATEYKEAYETMVNICNQLKDSCESMKLAYEDARQAWTRTSSMSDILLDIITTNGLENVVIDRVSQRLEDEHESSESGFSEHDEGSYKELLHELKTRWDFSDIEACQ